jgi:hypothetical protein
MRIQLVTAAVLTAAFGVVGLPPASASVSVCGNVGRCHVVARTDVNGDGRVDVVAFARRGKDGTKNQSVIVRVKVGPRRIVSTTRSTPWWSGSLWQGAAALDTAAGKELVLGATMGAHTEFFRVLTWRSGKLVRLRAPGGASTWVVDGAVNVSLGWQHRVGDDLGVVRRLVATRKDDGSMTGTISTYQSHGSRWTRISRQVRDPVPDDVAYAWGGWRVPGLDRW